MEIRNSCYSTDSMERKLILKNIFLTGDINAGKSTIINKVINMLEKEGQVFSGFKTLPYLEENKQIGFYIESVKGMSDEKNILERMIGKCIGYRKAIGITDTFERLGVKILKESFESQNTIIIMDELGILEKDAFTFQKLVHSTLSSKQMVLGVLKLKSHPFLNSIRNRRDVEVIEVNPKNRDNLPLYIYKKIKSICRKGEQCYVKRKIFY